MAVRLVGVALAKLTPGARHQRDFFNEEGFVKRARLCATVDGIRDRYGFGALVVGPSMFLMDSLERKRDGVVLRTPSLSQ